MKTAHDTGVRVRVSPKILRIKTVSGITSRSYLNKELIYRLSQNPLSYAGLV